ncbi:hypothetical protein Air01nite_08470 [Asanoa iriomotensis]|uniref:YbaB/EbfC DNA-binding family protein n=1 Tax=Asanoa iriomotensis TaxID=234613 RepID=A0ABQ4BW57_9ACTN|nr:hypothetical protein Air01nite_08470 [Asanoa iriomotensis]
MSAASVESPVGSGAAADGLIAVRVALPGRVVDMDLDPAVLRLPVAVLAESLTSAVNDALADLQARLPSGSVDLDVLGSRLHTIQRETARQFSAFTESLVDAQAALARRAGR